jgi:ligand-binding sensor domain-containing protein
MKRILLAALWLPGLCLSAPLQPSRPWTSHTNFNRAVQLAVQPGGNIIWGATPGGAFSFSAANASLVRHYTNVDGLPYIEVSSIALDTRQNKWIGTMGGGLALLDSAGTVWRLFSREDGMASDTVLCTATAGQMAFAGGYGSLSCFDGYSWSSLLSRQGYPLGEQTRALAARNDSLWIATDQGLYLARISPLASIRDTAHWSSFPGYDGLSSDILSLLLDSVSSFIGASNGAARLSGGSWQRIPGLDRPVRSICRQEDSVYFATDSGVKLWSQNILSDASAGLPDYNVLSLARDDSGRLWSGGGRGICRLDEAGWTDFGFDGPRENFINDLALDRDGTLWLAHYKYPEISGGISCLQSGGWQYLNQSSTGRPIDQPSCIGITADHSLWVGTWGLGLFSRSSEGLWRSYASPTPLPTPYLAGIVAWAGGVWVINYDVPSGVDAVSFFSQGDSSWSAYYSPVNKFYPICLAPDARGNLWIGSYYNGLYRRSPEGVWTNWSPASGLASNHVAALWHDQRDNLWIGTDNGLLCYDGSHFIRYGAEDSPLLSNNIRSLSGDRSDNLWIGTDRGLSCRHWNGSWTSYVQEAAGSSGLISNDIVKVLTFPATAFGDDIYIATSRGLSLYRHDDLSARTEPAVHLAPNPLNLNRDQLIYLSNLPSQARVDIYTLDGRPCGTFHGPAAPAHTLTIRPSLQFSRPPASGIYLCRIISEGSKAVICKLVIVR